MTSIKLINLGNITRHIDVTCAILLRDGLILAAQRSAVMNLPFKWEFPGGKIDPGESPEECLNRELNDPRLEGEGFNLGRFEIDYRQLPAHLLARQCIAGLSHL